MFLATLMHPSSYRLQFFLYSFFHNCFLAILPTVSFKTYSLWRDTEITFKKMFQIPHKNDQDHREITHHNNTIKIHYVLFDRLWIKK